MPHCLNLLLRHHSHGASMQASKIKRAATQSFEPKVHASCVASMNTSTSHWARAPATCHLHRHRSREPCSRNVLCRSSRTRQAKDPKAFKDMDELRDFLEQDGKPGFIAGTLNWISNSSFGATGDRQPLWSPARLYRLLTTGLQWTASKAEVIPEEDPSDPLYHKINKQHEAIGPLLLCSRTAFWRMARRYPPVLDMSAAEIAGRLLAVRDALPGCNASLLIELYPQLFLSGDAQQKRQQMLVAAQQLRQGLKGAAVADVIMVDPEILFMDLEHGLKELRDLWDVDEMAMANSEPKHLALAVRSLCNTKPKAAHV